MRGGEERFRLTRPPERLRYERRKIKVSSSDQGRVEAASAWLAEATRVRDMALLEAHERGASLRNLASWSGLNHETVRTIIRRSGQTKRSGNDPQRDS